MPPLPPFKLGVRLIVGDGSPGSPIVEVFSNSLAARIKMMQGDILYRINGKPIETVEDVDTFLAESDSATRITFWQASRNKYRDVRVVQTYSTGTYEVTLKIVHDEELDDL